MISNLRNDDVILLESYGVKYKEDHICTLLRIPWIIFHLSLKLKCRMEDTELNANTKVCHIHLAVMDQYKPKIQASYIGGSCDTDSGTSKVCIDHLPYFSVCTIE